jgi:hypothetical protein
MDWTFFFFVDVHVLALPSSSGAAIFRHGIISAAVIPSASGLG